MFKRFKARAAARTRLGDFEHEALRLVHYFGRCAAVRGKRGATDFVPRRNQCPQHRAFAKNFGVGACVGGSGSLVSQRRQVFQATRGLEFATIIEPLGHSNDIAGIGVFGKTGNSRKDQAVILAVKIVRGDDVRYLVPGLMVEHQPTKQRLLGFDGVWRHFETLLWASRRHAIL